MSKTHFTIVYSIVLVALFVFSAPQVVTAQWGGAPYGGRSTMALPCTCTPGCVLVEVGPPRPASTMYCPGATRLYPFANIFPPAWQLGLGGTYIACMQVGGPSGCFSTGGGMQMIIDGTSLY